MVKSYESVSCEISQSSPNFDLKQLFFQKQQSSSLGERIAAQLVDPVFTEANIKDLERLSSIKNDVDHLVEEHIERAREFLNGTIIEDAIFKLEELIFGYRKLLDTYASDLSSDDWYQEIQDMLYGRQVLHDYMTFLGETFNIQFSDEAIKHIKVTDSKLLESSKNAGKVININDRDYENKYWWWHLHELDKLQPEDFEKI